MLNCLAEVSSNMMWMQKTGTVVSGPYQELQEERGYERSESCDSQAPEYDHFHPFRGRRRLCHGQGLRTSSPAHAKNSLLSGRLPTSSWEPIFLNDFEHVIIVP